jgi:hypothetical protein
MRAVVVACMLAAVACGVRSQPFPPELVQPQTPTSLVARSATDGIHLTWGRPTSYTGGKHMRDLAGFDIERATGVDTLEFTHVGSVELTDQTRFQQERKVEWTDPSATTGTTYRYRIVAYTMDGYRSAPAGPVTIEHTPGTSAHAPPPPPSPAKGKAKKKARAKAPAQ